MYKELKVHGRDVREIVDDMPDLRKLQIGFSHHLDTIHRLDKLTKLTIFKCCLLGFDFKSLDDMHKLKWLKLISLNNPDFGHMNIQSLTKLNIYDCPVDDLSSFSELDNLKSLSVERCKLQCVKHTPYNLTDIDINNNNVYDVTTLCNIKPLTRININNNPAKRNLEMKSAVELLDMGLTPDTMSLIVDYAKPEVIDEMKAIIASRKVKVVNRSAERCTARID